jgi:hypothetical protein
MTATRAQYTEALTLSSDAFEDFTKHLQTCSACRPVRTDCSTRDALYSTADRLRRVVDDIVTGWAEARRSAADTAPTNDQQGA